MNIEEEVTDVLEQIKSAKFKGKKSIKIKVYQADILLVNGNKRYKNVYIKTGMFENGNGETQLKKLGYNISYEKQQRKNLIPEESIKNTTVMIVRW